MNKTIFVTGGTGNQGGAVARNLIEQDFTVKVLCRNIHSSKAQNLKSLGVELVEGDLDKPETYREHLKGVDGVFSVQTFVNGVEKEISQGKRLAKLSKEFNVKHFVYSSVLGADLHTGVPHFDSKFTIENYIREIELPFTIIRPASLYENFLIPQVKKGILKGKFEQPLNADTVQQYIAADDIGKAVSIIFSNSPQYLNKTIPLANAQMSTQETAAIFAEALNKKMVYKKLPAIIVRLFLGKNLYKMFTWLNDKNVCNPGDVEATNKELPETMSLKNWIEKNFE